MTTWMSRILTLVLTLLVAAGLGREAAACVGKTLTIGTTGGAQQTLLAEVVALLITERTGTTVKVETFESFERLHQAQLKAEVDITIGYTAQGQLEVLRGEPIADAAGLFEAVKARYNQELNLVWLEPFGFDRGAQGETAIPDQAAPVVRKDTLRKFPALARLISRLGGTINEDTLARLEEQSQAQGARDVARTFLRDNRLI
ncbi:glycine betaine ABC transporter substrate-binding protein [Geoalkalibacter sp.]|uniref:glycine betaine ABC transporter substrate-binding protein n=1 Tax=Geoalkalibacter sp. TaxID=3041440 RepID=UPI00272E15E7|nr:glycine betaine ABC transporter substrate-binding protein [Geoalkalibacter sp.]